MKGGFPIVLYYITRTFPRWVFPHQKKGGYHFFTKVSLRLPARRPWSLHSCPFFDASGAAKTPAHWRFRCIKLVIQSGIKHAPSININYTYRLLVGFFGSKQKCQLSVLKDLWEIFFGCCEGGLEIGNLTMKSPVNSVDDPFRPPDVRIVTMWILYKQTKISLITSSLALLCSWFLESGITMVHTTSSW